jgi:chaperonin GroEL
VIDAVCATRAALREGIVAGGGSALLLATKHLETLRGDNDDQNTGIQIVRNAIRLPCELIANNAGLQGGVIAQRILQKGQPGYGYDAQRSRYVDMFEAGIVDPLLVVRTTLSDAASVAGLMLTTESIVCEESEESHIAKLRDPDGTLKKKSQVRFPLNNVAAGLEGILNS